MAKTPSSSKSESVTLRIPNEIFRRVLDYATANTKGNRSEAIVELIELGLANALSQQSTQSEVTLQDIIRHQQLSETVTALENQVSQLTDLVQATVLQRLTEVETELMGESKA
ncbi:hypothetical protein [Chroococcidiopsis sp. SAG 2025]|uniref:hypothetical protein n=1 Tax=Chroococcidiopsis sp. SAG 2025 TaxID=171389 RepID=UPI002936F725|nr:hypothetical protein [Chroococcidiopsis sp. SAG 2025]